MGKKSVNKKPQKADPKEHLLLGIKRDELEIRKYEKLLKIKKRKNKSKFSEIFMDLDPISDDECGGNDEDNMDTEEEEDIDDEEEMDDDEEEEQEVRVKKEKGKEAEKAVVNGDHVKIKRNILAHLNRLCESQMMKCLDGIEQIWNEYPRGDVRDIFIRESLSFMKLSCIDLAAFVGSLHSRLAKQTNLLAFYLEHLVDKLTAMTRSASWASEETTLGAVTEGYKFVALLTRLELIDTNLIIDLMDDIGLQCDTAQLKLLADISSIVGFFVRKHSPQRCDELVAALRTRMAASGATANAGDISEIRSLAGAVIDKLTTAKAKNDALYEQAVKYRRLMRTWARNSSKADAGAAAVALRLADFRGDNRARWWLVGSAVSDPRAVLNRTAAAIEAAADSSQALTDRDREWNALALQLGFATDGKQSLFRTMMRAQDNEDEDAAVDEAMATVRQVTQAAATASQRMLVPESEVVAVVVRCLTLQKQFCQFYPNLLAAMIEAHRRYRQLVKCAIWDVISQPKLVDSARVNCGRCVGQLIAVADFPVNCLRKYNFLDDSTGNVGFLTAVVSELVEESWDDIADLLQQMASSISTKFVGNFRLFLKKNFKGPSNADKWSKAVQLKVDKCIEYLQELRKNAD